VEIRNGTLNKVKVTTGDSLASWGIYPSTSMYAKP
jgi:hypothetical protein